MRLVNRFDLLVRKARTAGPERQLDLLLGILFALPEWVLWNTGTEEKPWPAITEDTDGRWLVVFPGVRAAQDYLEGHDASLMTVPTHAATEFCGRFRVAGVNGLLVNPGASAYQVTLEALEAFEVEWKAAQARHSQGFWIPNMTSEEEDFWQEHGL